jgi:hypothetical protein
VDETALTKCRQTLPSAGTAISDACYSMRFANCTLGSCWDVDSARRKYDAQMPRTRSKDDALKVAKVKGSRNRQKVTEAASKRPIVTDARTGFQVVRLSRRSPKVTAALVKKLRDEFP